MLGLGLGSELRARVRLPVERILFPGPRCSGLRVKDLGFRF